MRLYVEGNTPFNAAIKSVDWKVASADQTLFLDLLGYVKLLSVTGKWAADSGGARKFGDPVMKLRATSSIRSKRSSTCSTT